MTVACPRLVLGDARNVLFVFADYGDLLFVCLFTACVCMYMREIMKRRASPGRC